MGKYEVSESNASSAEKRDFTRALLRDLDALERMLAEGRIESGIRRIGAEQEVFFVDELCQPANVALGVLARLEDPRFTTELGQFNAEANLSPRVFEGDCLVRMEDEAHELLGLLGRAAAEEGARVVLCGILPTLRKAHLSLESMTPKARYRELNRIFVELRGESFSTLIKGLDQLQVSHDSVMLEACNTSFQVHFQVGADEFPRLYNLAQVVTAPVLAAAVNSAVLLQHRLWHETRVALMQQALDTRSKSETSRGKHQRVRFGDRWVEQSVLEIFRRDVARNRVLLSLDQVAPPMEALDRGEVPDLRALCFFNGTVYRWNRPCYGVSGGRAHLRIENRALPAGPTVRDEIANAAFFFGLMTSLADEYGDVSERMEFDHAKANFLAAARYGLNTRLQWLDGRVVEANRLILDELLPLARQGLAQRGIQDHGREYLDVIEERVRTGRTGAQWALDSISGMKLRGKSDACCRALTASMVAQQARGAPVHEWPLATLEELSDAPVRCRTVAQVMTTDLFTVGPDDLVDLAASLMDWEHIRHVPVEDARGHLVGLLSHRALLRLLARNDQGPIAVSDVMKPDPVTVTPETTTLEAIEVMRKHRVSCLPVVSDGHLAGILTEVDLLDVAAGLLEDHLGKTR